MARGRPIELTPEIIEAVANGVRAGNYTEVAAAAAGVAKSTLMEWLKRGRQEAKLGEVTVFVELLDAVKKAQAEAESATLKKIELASEMGNWQAAAWRLERRHPERWGSKRATAMEKRKLEKEIQLIEARTRALEAAGAIDSALGGAIAASAIDDPDAVRSRIATLALKLAPEVYAKMFPTLGGKGDGNGE